MSTIAFDGICFGDGPPTGVARAFADTLAAYVARGEADCVLLLPDGATCPDLARVRSVRAPRGALRRQRRLPALLRELGADLLHSPVAAVPLRAPCPTIATVHDLPWLHADAPEHTGRWRRFATQRALCSAARVLAPSTMTARDAERLLAPDARRVERVPHGTPAPIAPPPDPATRSGPLLVLGDDRPRKNRARLCAAHAIARRRCPDLPDLRFVGPPDDYVDEAEKRRLLRACRVLVHVSLFEGFGLPVLEGLAHGAPVVCSDLPPHREIADGCARFVDPRATDGIAAALLQAHHDEAWRQRAASAGPLRARHFRPEHTAAAWTRIHAEVLA
ncbi:MAG TPA: glycosyltransferase family 1 protein [bacterium]|nr:glycosyltransferase family 1 protein [bacterium]